MLVKEQKKRAAVGTEEPAKGKNRSFVVSVRNRQQFRFLDVNQTIELNSILSLFSVH